VAADLGGSQESAAVVYVLDCVGDTVSDSHFMRYGDRPGLGGGSGAQAAARRLDMAQITAVR